MGSNALVEIHKYQSQLTVSLSLSVPKGRLESIIAHTTTVGEPSGGGKGRGGGGRPTPQNR